VHRADGAAAGAAGQVQHGNTWRKFGIQRPARSFLRLRGALDWADREMESVMRKMWAASLVVISGVLAALPAQADYVPAFKANDTGGIIAYSLASQGDARLLAVEHCAYYGKVVKFLAVQAYEGGYISFACRWVPYGANERPLVTRY
jgi:hypothetical protein